MGLKEKQLKDAIVIKRHQNLSTDETIFDLSLTICHRNTANNKDLEDPSTDCEIENYFAERLIDDAQYLINGALAEKYNEKLQEAVRRSKNEEVMGSHEIKRIFADMAFDIGISRKTISDALREMRVY